MDRLRCLACSVLLLVCIAAIPLRAQNTPEQPAQSQSQGAPAQPNAIPEPGHSPAIPANAPRISKETRLEIIRDFETQLVYSRTVFPMGQKGLQLRDGAMTPDGQQLQQLLALWGPAIKPGDPAHISYVRIYNDHIHFDLNGGPIRRKKWYQRVQISGASGIPVNGTGSDDPIQNPHGSYLDIYFDKYVPEMTAAQLRDLLVPALDFTAHNKEEAYLDTLPPRVKDAIKAHHVLVGMNSEMVVHAMGKAPRKVREKDGDNNEYEEWIYGQPPQDVDFVRIVGDEVVRVETMKVGGQKVVRTEKEVIIKKPDEDQQAKSEPDIRPANAPSMRRPGEEVDGPKPSDGVNPMPPATPPDIQQGPPSPPGSQGPSDNITGR